MFALRCVQLLIILGDEIRRGEKIVLPGEKIDRYVQAGDLPEQINLVKFIIPQMVYAKERVHSHPENVRQGIFRRGEQDFPLVFRFDVEFLLHHFVVKNREPAALHE